MLAKFVAESPRPNVEPDPVSEGPLDSLVCADHPVRANASHADTHPGLATVTNPQGHTRMFD